MRILLLLFFLSCFHWSIINVIIAEIECARLFHVRFDRLADYRGLDLRKLAQKNVTNNHEQTVSRPWANREYIVKSWANRE